MSAARSRFKNLPPIGGPLPLGMLSYRAAGSACATKVVDGRAIRKRPRVGSVSFAASNGRAIWSVDGAFEVVHVYLHPATIERVAEQQLGMPSAPEIDDFCAIEDPWLSGYFQMLLSELEVINAWMATPIRCYSTRASTCSSGTSCDGTRVAPPRGRRRAVSRPGRTRFARD